MILDDGDRMHGNRYQSFDISNGDAAADDSEYTPRREESSVSPDNRLECLDETDFGKIVKTVCDAGSEGVCMGIGIVCGAAGATLTTHHVLVLGFSGLAALSIGLGLNEFLSFRAQNIYLLNEYVTQRTQLENHRDSELASVVEIFVGKGVAQQDAENVVRTLAKYENVFLTDVYMPQKTGQLVTTPAEELLELSPLASEAFSTFLAVLVIGALPLLGAVAAYAGNEDNERQAFTVFYVMAALILYTMGALKSWFYGGRWYTTGLSTLLVGFACGLAGFVTGSSMSTAHAVDFGR